jgi:hypothetical protein
MQIAVSPATTERLGHKCFAFCLRSYDKCAFVAPAARKFSSLTTRMMAEENGATDLAEEEAAPAPANRKARRDAERAQKKGTSELEQFACKLTPQLHMRIEVPIQTQLIKRLYVSIFFNACMQ